MTLPASKMMRIGLLASRSTRSLSLASGAEAAAELDALGALEAVCACAVPHAPQLTTQPNQAEHKTMLGTVRMARIFADVGRTKPRQTPGRGARHHTYDGRFVTV